MVESLEGRSSALAIASFARFHSYMNLGRRSVTLLLVALAGCPSSEPSLGPNANPSPGPGAAIPGARAPAPTAATSSSGAPAREEGRFARIRQLLHQDPESRVRATKLFPMIDPLCKSEPERAAFIADVARAAGPDDSPDGMNRTTAIDTLQYVADACSSNDLEASLDLLAKAKAQVAGSYRPDLIRAQLLAAGGRFADAESAAQAALNAGSIHAIALTANIQAQRARSAQVGYTPGMLDPAIQTVSVEPQNTWQMIDLTAVLSTRAHLLSERAVWETGEPVKATLKEARQAYERLAVAPFIEATRNFALDQLCFDAVETGDSGFHACAKAVAESGNAGAAVLAGAPKTAEKVDLERLQKLAALHKDLDQLGSDRMAIVVARGDETELISWARPAAELLKVLAARKVRVVLLDRTSTPRATALVDRMVALGGVTPVERIAAGKDTLAMPCLTAIVAHRRTPEYCPFQVPMREHLGKLGSFAVAFLVGRDLDAEVDDLHLYGLRTVLVSFRKPLTEKAEKGIDVQLKSLSDAWLISPRSAELAGSQKPKG
jgi:hypothetical protein